MRAVRFGLSIVIAMAFSACGSQETPSSSRPGQIIDEDDLEVVEAAKGTELYDYARAVARVDLGNAGCTGFRVARDLFITNHHCWDGSVCSQTKFILGYERDTPADQRVTMNCSEVVAVSQSLDYALYRVTVPSAANVFPIVTLSRRPATAGQSLFIAGYPFGYEFKRMDRSDNCRFAASGTDTPSTWIAYTCDTDSGSSGSSVFDRATGHVVGLHWGHAEGPFNNGTGMGYILDDIRTQAPVAYQQLTIAE